MSGKAETWMPLYIGDYMADTGHLSAAEHGAYLLLLMHYWRQQRALPDDDRLLARVARMSPAEWSDTKPIIGEFFRLEGGYWFHSRVQRELDKAQQRSKAAREKAEKRWSGADAMPNKTSAMPEQCPSIPTAMPQVCSSPSPSPLSPPEPLPEPPTPSGVVPRDEIRLAVECWNSLAAECDLPIVQRLTDPRKRSLAARLRECGGIEGWHAALNKIRGSGLCRGQVPGRNGSKPWRADFDFMLQPSSFLKLMEGSYDGAAGPPKPIDMRSAALDTLRQMSEPCLSPMEPDQLSKSANSLTVYS